MKKNVVLTVAIAGIAVVALGAVSASYILDPMALDQGGGLATSSSYELQGSIGGAVVGTAASASYKLEVGYMGTSGAADWLQITQLPTPDTIGPGGSSQFKWVSAEDGTFYIELGGDGSIGSGTQLRTGSCTAASEETETISDTVLVDNASNAIYVIVDSASGVIARQVVITDDQLTPVITLTQVAITGTVDDVTVTEVLVNSSSVTVIAGSYSTVLTTGLSTITIEATNGDSKTVTRTIEIQ